MEEDSDPLPKLDIFTDMCYHLQIQSAKSNLDIPELSDLRKSLKSEARNEICNISRKLAEHLCKILLEVYPAVQTGNKLADMIHSLALYFKESPNVLEGNKLIGCLKLLQKIGNQAVHSGNQIESLDVLIAIPAALQATKLAIQSYKNKGEKPVQDIKKMNLLNQISRRRNLWNQILKRRNL